MKKSKIIFNGIKFNGGKQKEWFKLFDLLDKIFSDKEKEKMSMSFEGSEISCFNFDFKKLPKGTTKREFADFVANHLKDKILEVNTKTGEVIHYANETN